MTAAPGTNLRPGDLAQHALGVVAGGRGLDHGGTARGAQSSQQHRALHLGTRNFGVKLNRHGWKL